MRTLSCLLATAALLGGVAIANAQSGSPSQPSGPMAGGAGTGGGTQGRATVVRGAVRGVAPSLGMPPAGSSGSSSQPSGAKAGGAPNPR
jgi:hypothetical protein